MLIEHIPGGAKWRYVWGSTLAFVFSLQLITGVMLMTAYSPSDNSAWGSVHYIQYQMDWGWLIRGLHHFGSQTMMVLIGLHMLQVVIAGAHLPPREFNWWSGLVLLGITFGLSLTGYLLPWDQKGYWATRVATNIAGNTPGIGPYLQRVIVGGADYGNHTLTRFYALHVGILPPLLIGVLIVHLVFFRRHGVTHPANPKGEGGWFWPDQAFRDLLVCLVIFGIMLALVLKGHGHAVEAPHDPTVPEPSLYQEWAKAGQKGLGANLDAPADRDTSNYPARPEWYFLFLFQLLKYFHGELVTVGTFYIPNGVMFVLAFLPLLGYGRMRTFGHLVSIFVIIVLFAAVMVLTYQAIAEDSPEPLLPILSHSGGEKATEFQKEVHKAEKLAARAAQLAMSGIPASGSRSLLRNDPLTKGHDSFKIHCATCHQYTLKEGDHFSPFINDKYTASDLGDYASEAWIRGLLESPGDAKYFGRTDLQGMQKWKKGVLKARMKMSKDEIEKEEAEFTTISKWLADQKNPEEKRDKKLHASAKEMFENHCSSCHKVGDLGENDAPELTNYGSADWIRMMVMSPAHKTRYGAKNTMPAFRTIEGPGSEVSLREFLDANPEFPKDKIVRITEVEREMIIRFMLRDYRTVFGGEVIAAPPR